MSDRNRFPYESKARPLGELNWAFVAGPKSPEYPGVPVPATTVWDEPSGLSLKIVPPFAPYIFPTASKARPVGWMEAYIVDM